MWHPDWAPPADVKHDIPCLPNLINGGTPGNPMGVAALVLTGGDYAIHGTNRPQSVGGFVSYGCIRMYNADITRLFREVTSAPRSMWCPEPEPAGQAGAPGFPNGPPPLSCPGAAIIHAHRQRPSQDHARCATRSRATASAAAAFA